MKIITINAKFNQDEVYTIIGYDDRFTKEEILDLSFKIWNEKKGDGGDGTTVNKFNRMMRLIPGITVFDGDNIETIYI